MQALQLQTGKRIFINAKGNLYYRIDDGRVDVRVAMPGAKWRPSVTMQARHVLDAVEFGYLTEITNTDDVSWLM